MEEGEGEEPYPREESQFQVSYRRLAAREGDINKKGGHGGEVD